MHVSYTSNVQSCVQCERLSCIPCIPGNYWIDPNGGVRDDAVLAFCHFESLSSCILPKNLKVRFIIFYSTAHVVFFSWVVAMVNVCHVKTLKTNNPPHLIMLANSCKINFLSIQIECCIVQTTVYNLLFHR